MTNEELDFVAQALTYIWLSGMVVFAWVAAYVVTDLVIQVHDVFFGD